MNPDARRQFATEVVATLRARASRRSGPAAACGTWCWATRPPIMTWRPTPRPRSVMKLFRRTVPVGVSFGVVRVLGPVGAGEVEVATFRTDGRYLDGRRPESVTFGTPEEDAARRDFTINGMFLDPLSGEILDFVGGHDDLQARRIRAIGDPVARFHEDKLRLSAPCASPRALIFSSIPPPAPR